MSARSSPPPAPRTPAHTHFIPPPRCGSGEPCWHSGHQRLSGECVWPRGVAGRDRSGPVRGAGKAGAQLPRRLLRAASAGSARPPARPRAARGGGGERSLRRLHPAPSREEAPLSGAAGRALPHHRLGARHRAGLADPQPAGTPAGGEEGDGKGKRNKGGGGLLFCLCRM